jgi:isopenicillin-N epimerase
VRSACHRLAVETWERINDLTGQPLLHSDPETWFAQITVSTLPTDTDIVTLKRRLSDEYHVEIPLIDWHGNKLIRLSVQGYNSKRDMDKLLAALSGLLA